MEGRFLLETYWARRLCWPPAGKFWISGIQNFETLIFVIFDPNWSILDNFCRNSSYRISGPHYRFQQLRHVFFILSGVLNIFLYKKKVFFLGFNFPGQTVSTFSNPFPDPAVWKRYPCEWRIAIPASLMRVDNPGLEFAGVQTGRIQASITFSKYL